MKAAQSKNWSLDSVEDQAAQWFAEVSNQTCSPARKQAFQNWLDRSPEHAAAYHQVELLWQASASAVVGSELAAAAREALRFEEPPSRLKPWLGALGALAAAVIVAVIVPRWLGPAEPPAGIVYATKVGEQRSLALPDGSRMLLDTETIAVERFSAGERRIDLQQGRAQFVVQHDAENPFVVHVLGGTVKALGTEFQVRRSDETALVTLIQGKLAVSGTPEPEGAISVRLTGGQQVAFKASGSLGKVEATDLQMAEAWTQGKLFVRNWTLSELLTETNRYTQTKITLGDETLGDIRISGVFMPADQDTLLLVLDQGWAIRSNKVSADRTELVRR